jgi:hypothetical protein
MQVSDLAGCGFCRADFAPDEFSTSRLPECKADALRIIASVRYEDDWPFPGIPKVDENEHESAKKSLAFRGRKVAQGEE